MLLVAAQDVVLVAPCPWTVGVSTADEKPVAGAVVEAAISGEDAPRLPGAEVRGVTGAEGRVTLELPRGLSIRLVARTADGSAEGESSTTAHPLQGILKTIVVRPKPADRR